MGILGGAEWLEEAMDVAAWLMLTGGDVVAAADLLAAATVRWNRIESHARPLERQWHASLTRQVQQMLAGTSEANWPTESTLSDVEAVRYALTLLAQRAS